MNTERKLNLKKETLRVLNPAEQVDIDGGAKTWTLTTVLTTTQTTLTTSSFVCTTTTTTSTTSVTTISTVTQ